MAAERSDFEDGWLLCPPANALVQRRTWEYDRQSALLYAPTRFEYEPIRISRVVPDDEWFAANFLGFVRGEFKEDLDDIPPYPGLPSVQITSRSESGTAYEYLDACEALVYGGYLDGLLTATGDDVVEQLHAILADKRLGNPRNARNVTVDALRQLVAPLLADRHRIRFVLPAFPFKDQNPFRTRSKASSPDMADVALLIHMHLITQALYQVHPHGVDWILLTDGLIYADTFGISKDDARAYRERLRDWRSWLNLTNTVHIVDLQDLVDRLDHAPADPGAFSRVMSSLRSQLVSAVDAASPEFRAAFNVLRRGMAWNLNTREELARVSEAELWEVLKTIGHPRGAETSPLAIAIGERATAAAIEYASVNLALRYFDAINTLLPGSVRATIHPKSGQIAAPRVGAGDVFPWNGVPVIPASNCLPGDIHVDGLHGHLRRYSDLFASIDSETGDPFVYRAPAV